MGKILPYELCEIAGFPWQRIMRFLRMGITHISAATHPKLLNMVPTDNYDIGLSYYVQICKRSNLHIHEY